MIRKKQNEELTNLENKISEKKKSKTTLKKLRILLLKITFIVLFIYISFGYIFGLKRMNQSYMTPNIKEGDLVFYYRLEKEYKVGDVVVINKDNKEYVLRIVATSDQIIDMNSKDEFLVDGYVEPYNVYYKTKKYENINYPYTIPKDEYFVLADYRQSAKDSRVFGTITKDEIKGKVISKLQVRNI